MSARAWRWRRDKPPVYLVRVDWWSDETLLNGPPPRARRVDLARRRRLEQLARRRARRRPPHRPPWSYPDANVMGDLAAAMRELTGALDLSAAQVRALSRTFYPLRRPIVETPPL